MIEIIDKRSPTKHLLKNVAIGDLFNLPDADGDMRICMKISRFRISEDCNPGQDPVLFLHGVLKGTIQFRDPTTFVEVISIKAHVLSL